MWKDETRLLSCQLLRNRVLTNWQSPAARLPAICTLWVSSQIYTEPPFQ